jgi:hypothetical protein
MKAKAVALGAWLGLLILVSGAGGEGYEFSPKKKNHWAWKPPVRSEVPAVKNEGWVRNSIDAFILAKLEAAGLQPAASAKREQLIRRVTFDLIGLPPTPAEIDAFVNDSSANAWEKVIDRLLASPHYGERWGRHWLDLARFADSNGYEHDEIRPDAWRYRDYVIRSFNEDKPYDRFIKEQLAGDELYPDDPDALIATGFNLLGPDMTDNASQVQRRQNTLDDMTDTAGLVFLGMTVGCARCHNHKFEPILQSDFYRLQAFFVAADFRSDLPVADRERRLAHERAMQKYQALIKPTTDALAELEGPHRLKLRQAKIAKLAEAARVAHQTPAESRTPLQKELVRSTERFLVVNVKDIMAAMPEENRLQYKRLQDELRKFDSHKLAALPAAMGLKEKGDPAPKTFLLFRGELNNRGDEVQPGVPVILTPGHEEKPLAIQSPSPQTSGRRASLANWIASPDHPLTARVMVNRLWQHHFGRGIVPTASDFGVRGQPPSHAELLDWLATELVARGWSLKYMHKLMLLSATYQQSTVATPQAAKTDPNNDLFSRMNRLRLEGEIVRDSLLTVSGRLNPKMGGPGVFPVIPVEALRQAKDWKVSPDPAEHARRTIYLFARRNLRVPFLDPFDLPDSNHSCPKREQSTTAPQALALLNSADVLEAAKALAARLEKETSTSEERIALGYRLALGRQPTQSELSLARDFLDQSPLSEFCRALFNLNEFVYLD